MYLYFHHKYDTDSLRDGGYIDVSYDNGVNWLNVYNESDADSKFYQNLYTEDDTIINGDFAFSGNYVKDWKYSGVEWYWENEQASVLDSILIRFNFMSDEVAESKSGWIIDNIYVLIEDYCTDGIDNMDKNYGSLVYPNPVKDMSILELPDNNSIYQIRIFNIQGQQVFNCLAQESLEIHRLDFKPGIYIYLINNDKNKIFKGKFIIN